MPAEERPAAELAAVPSLRPVLRSVPRLDPFTFLELDDLLAATQRLVPEIPPDVDLVVGIARSGLIPAAPLATWLHRPLLTYTLTAGVVDPGAGGRMLGFQRPTPRRILLVDDTASTGQAMREAAIGVAASFPGVPITRAAVYTTEHAAADLDLYAAIYPPPHYLSWNWCNAGHGEKCGYDFDGILVADGSPFAPLYLPRRLPIPLIVSGRHESARELTQGWLDQWGVRCDRLVLRGFDAPDHYDTEAIAALKAREYAASDCALFAESDPTQAERIAELSGKPVLCPVLGRVIPGRPPQPPVVAAQPDGPLVAAFKEAIRCAHWRQHPTYECVEKGVCAIERFPGKDVYLRGLDCVACVTDRSFAKVKV
jgi:hypoxanthine phosphoribosyltransferase